MTATDVAPVAAFKEAASCFPTGVTVVTTADGDLRYGITVSAFVSLSIDPLLVAVSVRSDSPMLPLLRRTEVFGVSVLSASQTDVSTYFATTGRGPSLGGFPGIATHEHTTGAPLVDDALATFDCRMVDELPGGDHRLVVGEVVRTATSDRPPLAYFRRSYARIVRDTEETDS